MMQKGIAIMFLPAKAHTFASLVAHSTLVTKVAIGIVAGAAFIVAVGMFYD